MSDYEYNCYQFVLNLTKELASDYKTQYQNMELFARWNLPEETALEWIDAEGMIAVLAKGNCVSNKAINLMQKILNCFYLAFEMPDNPVWTHNAMKSSDFWKSQRTSASELLDELHKTKDGSPS